MPSRPSSRCARAVTMRSDCRPWKRSSSGRVRSHPPSWTRATEWRTTMSSAPGRRLRKIEEALEPTEAMALWLTEARQSFDTLYELVADLRAKPDEALPLFRLTRQAEAMAKNRLKGQASVFAAL